jgi:ABC-2 type transport system permease protein
MLDGRGWMDITVPAYIGLIVGTVGLMGIPIATSAAREKGVLRRYHASPLRPVTYLVADVAVYLIMTLLGIVLLFIVGRIAYHIRIDGNLLSLLGGICLATFSFMALGYLLAAVSPTARVAQVVGMVLFYPMMFLSGAAVPLEVMPEGVQNVARFMPLNHVVTLMKGLWFAETWGDHLLEVGVLGGMLLLGTTLSARLFRWE